MKNHDQSISQHQSARLPFNGAARRWVVLVAVCTFTAIALATGAWAQTCNDGCFYSNTYQGQDALSNFFSGGNDTAFGSSALTSNTGTDNTALGAYTLVVNTDGLNNTAVGSTALYNNDGSFNTAVGALAMISNSSGYLNTAVGDHALYTNTGGVSNTAIGAEALYSNKSINNTAVGGWALYLNLGAGNTASGAYALLNNTTGSSNTAVGNDALLNSTTGSSNIAFGDSAGSLLTIGNNNIDIGNKGVAGDSNKIRIGTSGTQTATFVAGILGTVVTGGQAVLVNSSGQLGVKGSSARFKEAIQSMGDKSDAILCLRPVSFRYKKTLDPKAEPQFGLIAEEVAKVDRDLVVTDENGKPFSVRYEEVNAMLLNEFLKAHRKLEEQGSMIVEQQKQIRALIASLKEQALRIQKVSDQLEANKSTPRVVAER